MKSFFRRTVLFLFALFLALSVVLGTVGNFSHKSYVTELLIAAGMVLIAWRIRRKRNRSFLFADEKSAVRTAAVLTICCLVLNGAWVLLFRPVQAADYQTFWQAAVDLSEGNHPQAVDYLAMFPHILGYSTFLSFFLKVFGQHVLVAALLNVVLTCISGLLIFRLARSWISDEAAVLAYGFWMICPSKLLYNPMVLAEPYYTCLLLGFFFLLSEAEKHEDTWGAAFFMLFGAMGGLLAGLVNTARPIGIVMLIALILWLLFLKEHTGKRLKWGALTVAAVLVYTLTGMLWNRYVTNQIGQEPPSIPGYNIYVGWNTETGGSYEDEDMTWFQSRYFGEFERNAQETQKAMLESAKERISSAKAEIPSLMLRKLRTLLGNDEGGAFYSRESLSGSAYALLCVISNVWYYAVCLLALCGCGCLWRQKSGESVFALVLCGLGLILAQLLVEVAARYHYSLIPELILLAVCGAGSQKKMQNGRKTES